MIQNDRQFILTEYSKPRLVNAIHNSWNTLMSIFLQFPQSETIQTPELTVLCTNLKITMFNRVIKTNLTPRETDEKIKEIIDYFASKSLPFTWQVDPNAQPFDLADRLEKAGLLRNESPGMAIQFENLVEPKSPEGFTYRKVDTPILNDVYARILPEAYGVPEFGWDWMFQFFMHLGIVDDFVHYVGYLDGHPVATSSVLYGEGVAGLYNVSNLPETRRKGVGSIMSYVPFIDAKKRNYRIGILHSTPMGYNMYKRLGFEEICKLIRYQWDPSN